MGADDPKRRQGKRKRIKAAALRYVPEKDNAPRLVAKGEGKVAEKIIALAKEHGIPISEDPDLVTILSKMDLGEEVSPVLYEVVAELLVFVYRLKQKYLEGIPIKK
jgi:flagellar biosynthesis protein